METGKTRVLSEKSPPHLWLVVAALLVAAALASHNMSHNFLWWDEHWSTQIAGTGIYGPLPLSQVWQNASADPWHPPGFYLILAGWARLFGGSQFALRLFPLLTGLLALAWTYRLGAWLGGKRVGTAALVILSGSAYFLIMMTELRPYMLYALFGVMCSALYWRLRSGKTNRAALVAFSFSVLGLFYAHYFAALIAAVLGGYHLLFVRKNRQWWRVVGYALVSVVLFVPWLVVFATAVKISAGNERFAALNTGDFLRMLADGGSSGVIPFLLVLAVGVVAAWRVSAGRFLLWVFGLFLGLALLVNLWLHILTHLRYVIVLWGFGAVIAGYGLVWLRRQPRYGRLAAAVVILAWWLVGGYQTVMTPDFRDRMFRSEFVSFFQPDLPLYDALHTIQPMLQANDIVLYDAPESPWAVGGAFDYYTGGWTIPRSLLSSFPDADAASLTPTLRVYTSKALRVWFVYETQPPDYHRAAFETVAHDEFTFCQTAFKTPALQIDEYARYGACCLPQQVDTPVAAYAGIKLETAQIAAQDAGSAALLMRWLVAPNVPPNRYSVGVYVLDAGGKVVAQVDKGLPNATDSCQIMTLPLTNVPPGPHELKMAVYNWQTLARLPGTTVSTTGSLLPIATLTVK